MTGQSMRRRCEDDAVQVEIRMVPISARPPVSCRSGCGTEGHAKTAPAGN
jgi:hypothetical protein